MDGSQGFVDLQRDRRVRQIFRARAALRVAYYATRDISRQKRESTGVRVINLEDGATLSAAALVPKNGD